MVRSAKRLQSTSGMNTRGLASCSRTAACMVLSIVRCSTLPQCLQAVSSSTETYSLRSCPCTKGAAIASSAQAA